MQIQVEKLPKSTLKITVTVPSEKVKEAYEARFEKVVQEAINHALQDRTALVVAHRLSTIKTADRILVLKKGNVVEEGTHEELIRKGGLYKKYYDIQFSTSPSEA